MQSQKFACRTWMGSILKINQAHSEHYRLIFLDNDVAHDANPRSLEIMRPFITLRPSKKEVAIQIPEFSNNASALINARAQVDALLGSGTSNAEEIGWLFTDHEGYLGLYWQDGSPVTYLPEWLLRTLLRQQPKQLSEDRFQSDIRQIISCMSNIPPFSARYIAQLCAVDQCPQDGNYDQNNNVIKLHISLANGPSSWWLFDRLNARWCMLHIDLMTPASKHWPLPDQPLHLYEILMQKLDALFG